MWRPAFLVELIINFGANFSGGDSLVKYIRDMNRGPKRTSIFPKTNLCDFGRENFNASGLLPRDGQNLRVVTAVRSKS